MAKSGLDQNTGNPAASSPGSYFRADNKKPLPLYPAIDDCDCEYCRWRRAQKKKRKKELAIIGHLFAALNRDIHDARRARDPLVSADNYRIWPLDPANGNNVVRVSPGAPNSVEFRRPRASFQC